MMNQRCLCWAAVVVVALVATPSAAHPVHATLAEVEWNAEQGHYEVALQMQLLDVERALRGEGKRRTVDDSPEVAATVGAYVAERFFATRIDGGKTARANVAVIGAELKPRVMWLYLTWSFNGEKAMFIENKLFFDTAKNQLNTVVVTERPPGAKDSAEKTVRSHGFNRKTPGQWNVAVAFQGPEKPRRKLER